MKKTFLLFFAISVLIVSCMDIEEKISLNNDNSGTYTYNIDMGRMMEMMSQMGQSDTKEKLPEMMDTTIKFKDFADTASVLTAEEKAALRDGMLTMHSNEKNNELKITLDFPFKNLEQLSYLKKNALTALGKMKTLNRALGKGGDADAKPGAEDNLVGGSNDMDMGGGSIPGTDMLSNAYSFSAGKNLLSNKLTNKESFSKPTSDSAMMAMQMMSMMMGDFNYKTIIILPQPAKKYSGNKAIISADKKTITFSNTLNNLMQKPESGEFSVEY